MGICLDLVDRRNRRIFHFGKVYVPRELFAGGPHGWRPFRNQVTRHLERAGFDGCAVRHRMARRIWAFCVVARWDVVLLSDGQTCDGEREPLELLRSVDDLLQDVEGSACAYMATFDGRTRKAYGINVEHFGELERFFRVASVYEDDEVYPDPKAEEQVDAEKWPEGAEGSEEA